MYCHRMTIQEIADELEVKRSRANYYREMLKKHDLIDPKPSGTKMIYAESDVQYFRRLHDLINAGANTATEALRLLLDNASPEELLEQNRRLNKQVEQLQKKVVALRKPTMWEKITGFFNNIFKRKVGGEREVT